MQREAKAYLWDVANAAASIHDFAAGKDLGAYLNDEMLRAAVERKFGVIGEALSQLLRFFPEYRDRIALVGDNRFPQPDRSRIRYCPGRHGVGDRSGLSSPSAQGSCGIARGAGFPQLIFPGRIDCEAAGHTPAAALA